MGDLVKVNNLYLIKWTLTAANDPEITQESDSFTIEGRKCTFFFHSGYNDFDVPSSLSIDFDKKEILNPSVNIIILVSSSSKVFPPEKHSVTGKQKQMIWSCLDYEMRGSMLTIEMVVHNTVLKDEKFVQTSPYTDPHVSLESFSKDFAKLLDEGPNHDVEFAFGEQIIKAHKSILCCRLDVFTSMLRSDMVESKTGRVNIQDMDVTIFQQFLKCLYTGILPEMTVDTAVQLYTASDKYAVYALKLQYAEFLIHNLSLENACEILVLADRHNDPEFKKSVMKYVFKEKIPVVGEKWSEFCNNNQTLAIEVLNSFCQKICQK